MPHRRVVITGLGLATPIGIELEQVWAALLEKRSGIKRISAYDPSGFRSQVGGEVPKFSLGNYIPKSYRKSTKVMCRDIQLAMVAAYQAVKDAGLKTKCILERGEAEPPSNLDPTRFGANIGAGLICADLTELAAALATAVDQGGRFSLAKWGREGMSNLTPLWLLKSLPNMLACHVTIVHDARAPSNTMTCAEASSHHAIGEAFRTIQRGAADVCICGGAESKMNAMGTIRQDLFGRLTHQANQHPEVACRPFDRDHCGTVVAEGGGLVILEELEHARKRDARIYGELVGFGASCNTHSWKEADPEGRGLARAIANAISDSGLNPGQISLITTFGTGIVSFDNSEAAAIKSVFGSETRRIRAMAIKGAVGNNGAGSGAIDFAVSLLAMKNNTVPASVGTEELAEECDIGLVTGDAVDVKVDNFVSIAYALSGGQTAALLVRRFEEFTNEFKSSGVKEFNS